MVNKHLGKVSLLKVRQVMLHFYPLKDSPLFTVPLSIKLITGPVLTMLYKPSDSPLCTHSDMGVLLIIQGDRYLQTGY